MNARPLWRILGMPEAVNPKNAKHIDFNILRRWRYTGPVTLRTESDKEPPKRKMAVAARDTRALALEIINFHNPTTAELCEALHVQNGCACRIIRELTEAGKIERRDKNGKVVSGRFGNYETRLWIK